MSRQLNLQNIQYVIDSGEYAQFAGLCSHDAPCNIVCMAISNNETVQYQCTMCQAPVLVCDVVAEDSDDEDSENEIMCRNCFAALF